MTLSTHAALGALIGAVASQNLALAATAAFASHFIFDTIPHWDYKLGSSNEDKNNPLNSDIKASGSTFVKDLIKIGFDFGLGFVIAGLMFYAAPKEILFAALVGAFFAMLPDPLQFAYMKMRVQPLIALQKFHIFMHAKKHYKDQPLIGVSMQVLFIGIIFVLSTYIFNLKG